MPDFSGFKNATAGAYIEKDPGAELTYAVDWSDWLPSGTNLDSIEFTVNSISGDTAPIIVGSSTIIDNRATVILSGGTAGNIYTITNTIVTDNSDTDVRRFRIKVEERYL